jgi:hypothetical protein
MLPHLGRAVSDRRAARRPRLEQRGKTKKSPIRATTRAFNRTPGPPPFSSMNSMPASDGNWVRSAKNAVSQFVLFPIPTFWAVASFGQILARD